MERTETIAFWQVTEDHSIIITVPASDYFGLLFFSTTNGLPHDKLWTNAKWAATLTKC